MLLHCDEINGKIVSQACIMVEQKSEDIGGRKICLAFL